MKCPKCGYERQPVDHMFVPGTECPSCGVVYSKYGSEVQDAVEGGGDKPSGTFKKPSPVHEDSLKQARERVEKRLRAKSAAHLPDEHRKQTMERAKQIVSESVRKRQAEWQLKKTMDTDGHNNDGDIGENPEQTEWAQPEAHETDAAFQPETDNGQPETVQASPQPEMNVPPEDNIAIEAEGSESNEQAPMVDAEQAQEQPFVEEAYGQGTGTIPAPAEETIESMDQSQPVASAMMADALSRRRQSNGLIRLLPTVAWIILAAGLVGAVLSWTTMGSVYAGPAVSPKPSGGGHIPVALLLGFAYLATGVLGFAFFWVSSMINGQLNEIRQLLMSASTSEDQSTSSTNDTL